MSTLWLVSTPIGNLADLTPRDLLRLHLRLRANSSLVSDQHFAVAHQHPACNDRRLVLVELTVALIDESPDRHNYVQFDIEPTRQ